ncbi:MAG TPA: hypothetical protein VFC86_12005 [Planctomycetota bacterium]|nr:hypothetical protein [Planctomycetota bacterium]
MGGNLACLGFAASTPQELNQALAPLIDSARLSHQSGGGFSHLLWRDPSGAAIAIHVRGGAIQCITPFYSPPGGASSWLVESKAALIDPECRDCSGAVCDVLDSEGNQVTRAAIQFLHFRPYAQWLTKPRRYRVDVSAFATELDVFATLADFDKVVSQLPIRGPDDVKLSLAPNFFIPVGMFGDEGQPSRILFAGSVSTAYLRTNGASGKKFWHLQVDALPGRIDVVHPEREGFYPANGQIALVGAWLVGRPVDPPPARPFWARLFGR